MANDIELPNESGSVDPRLKAAARAQRVNQRAYEAGESARAKRAKAKAPKRSLARRAYEGVRRLRR